jgi:hypothetical protein
MMAVAGVLVEKLLVVASAGCRRRRAIKIVTCDWRSGVDFQAQNRVSGSARPRGKRR